MDGSRSNTTITTAPTLGSLIPGLSSFLVTRLCKRAWGVSFFFPKQNETLQKAKVVKGGANVCGLRRFFCPWPAGNQGQAGALDA